MVKQSLLLFYVSLWSLTTPVSLPFCLNGAVDVLRLRLVLKWDASSQKVRYGGLRSLILASQTFPKQRTVGQICNDGAGAYTYCRCKNGQSKLDIPSTAPMTFVLTIVGFFSEG